MTEFVNSETTEHPVARRLAPDEVQAILAAGTFGELLGVLEDEHLECKRAPHQLADDHEKQELAKDVSGPANMSARLGVDATHILIGVGTEKSPQHHGDVIARVSPFEERLMDPDTLYRVLETWVLPIPEGLTIRWYPSAEDAARGIVAITVPRQRAELWPFIVTIIRSSSRRPAKSPEP